jgi:FlaA1/EpsC-like NDP-sugar epimerase
LRNKISTDCWLIIEVPSAERMIEQGRLDQVFNQHVNYYSVQSLEKLFEPLGFSLVELNYNFSYWGGTQLLAFSRTTPPGRVQKLPVITSKQYLDSIRVFLNSMESTSRKIEESRGDVYVYGAAQMLPTLLYHFSKTAKSKIKAIVDDNPSRQARYFPNLDLEIIPSTHLGDIESSVVIVGALDSARPILKRLLELSPRTVILPVGTI